MSEHGVFMRVASAIGDLGSPFYEEERQRDVWNEASAVGFQAMLWASLVGANVMIWVGRASAVPYALALMVIVGAGSLLAVCYAERSGVRVEHAFPIDRSARLFRPAFVLFVLLIAVFSVGMLVSVDWAAEGFVGGMAVGAAVGAAGGTVAMIGSLVWRRRKAARAA